jgi:hypothetical protein
VITSKYRTSIERLPFHHCLSTEQRHNTQIFARRQWKV